MNRKKILIISLLAITFSGMKLSAQPGILTPHGSINGTSPDPNNVVISGNTIPPTQIGKLQVTEDENGGTNGEEFFRCDLLDPDIPSNTGSFFEVSNFSTIANDFTPMLWGSKSSYGADVHGTGSALYLMANVSNGTLDTAADLSPMMQFDARVCYTPAPLAGTPAFNRCLFQFKTGETGLPILSMYRDMRNPNPVTGSVGIGSLFTSQWPPSARLDVYNLTNSNGNINYNYRYAGRFRQTGTYPTGTGSDELVGVYAKTDVTHGPDLSANLGGDFFATNAKYINIGARGKASGSAALNVGLWGEVTSGGSKNYAVYGTVLPPGNSNNFGVIGYIPISGAPASSKSYAIYGDLGIACVRGSPCTGANYAGYFNGDVYSSSLFITSDAKLKENISELKDPLEVLRKLNPKSYTFKQEENQSMQLPAGTHYGLIAQEVEELLPGLVKNSVQPERVDDAGKVIYKEIDFKAMNYMELIPFLVAGMKELDNVNKDLQKQIDDFKKQVSPTLPQDQTGTENSRMVELKSDAAVLYQNVPNPFDNTTLIRYFIPENTVSAKIIFMDGSGKVMKELDINERGMGSLKVVSTELNGGVYTYSLQLDGKITDTKKMIKVD